MLCQHLYNSLFKSALPLRIFAPSPHPTNVKDLQQWGENLAQQLDSYVEVYRERLAPKHEFVSMLNAKLRKLELYDRKAIETVYAELQTAHAAADKASQERKERGEKKDILLNNDDIHAYIDSETRDVIEACPTLKNDAKTEKNIMFASMYTVFEALLIQHDDDTLFNYEMNTDRVFDFFMNPFFAATPEVIEDIFVLRNIVDFKTYMASYSELIDILFERFSGKEYVYANINILVEYFLDVIGYVYAFSYRNFLRSIDAELLSKVENFQKIFEFHFFNFLSNVEHMRCSIHAFLNEDTMKMLATISGQYNVLGRHQRRHELLEDKRHEFVKFIDAAWANNANITDHISMLSFLRTTKSKKIQALCKLFGQAKTKDIVVYVLKKYDAVRGMPGFKKRMSGN